MCATIRAPAACVNRTRAPISAKIVTTQTGLGGPEGPPLQHLMVRLYNNLRVRLYNNG